MSKFYTSDTHFNHKGVLESCKRPWKTVDKMNQALIDNWNKVVKAGDIVYHLGDFALSTKHDSWDIDYIISQLKGQIFLIRGNHDDKNMKKFEKWFIKVDYLKYIKEEDGSKIMMCHYPMKSWRASIHGSFHLHGHRHGNLKPYGRAIDVGVDVWNYYPQTWDTLKTAILQNEEREDYNYLNNEK